MPELIAATPTAGAEGVGPPWLMFVLIGCGVLIILFLIWKALRDGKKAIEPPAYERQLEMDKEHAYTSANDRYFRSWWAPSKNAYVRKLYQQSNTGKIELEPLKGFVSTYAGHFYDHHGNVYLNVCIGKKWIIFPDTILVRVPNRLIHMQDDGIVVTCVDVDRQTTSSPYFPVIKNQHGEIIRNGFDLFDAYYEEKVSSFVIEKQGNNFERSVERAAKQNPMVRVNQRNRSAPL